MVILVALGGNALLQRGEQLSISTEVSNAATAIHHLAPLLKKEKLVITHGNGPQVGALLLRSELTKDAVYALPLAVCNAASEGEIGYVLEQELRNVLSKKNLRRDVASLVTLVEVAKNDAAFHHPTKPIGPFYTKKEASKLRKKGITLVEDAGRGYRRVVPSPKPLRIISAGVIEKLARSGVIVIASGGGGIPVVRTVRGWKGIDAVIDKDYASARLAHDLGARTFLMLTDVPCAYVRYRKKNQQALRRLTLSQAKKYLADGEFAEGSMGPKIAAAIAFLTDGNHHTRRVIITSLALADAALQGTAGTIITR